MRAAVTAEIKRVYQDARANIPQKTGASADALYWKVYRNKKIPGRISGFVGPRKRRIYDRRTGKLATLPKGDKNRHYPSKILHLLERGTKWAKPHPFISPAIDRSSGRQPEALANIIRTLLHRNTNRLRRKFGDTSTVRRMAAAGVSLRGSL